MSITQLNLSTDDSQLTASSTQDAETERQLIFSVSGRGKKQTANEEVDVEFADGLKTLPGWLVVNLGGKDMLESAKVRLKQIKFADFMQHWSQQNVRATIGRHLSNIRKDHVRQSRKFPME